MQTSYAFDPAIGFPGMRADSSPTDHISRLNGEASASLSFGIVVKQGSTEATCLLPSSSSDKLLGLVASSMSGEKALTTGTYAVASKQMASIARKGRFYALPEQTVAENDPVYVRYTVGAGSEPVGQLRKDADAAAQVITVTPTAVNSYQYQLSLDVMLAGLFRSFGYATTGDGSATATEICDALRTLINADTATHGITGTGTTTLILTGPASAAAEFTVQLLSGNLAQAATTPYAPKAKKLEGARWASAGTTSVPAVLELNLPA